MQELVEVQNLWCVVLAKKFITLVKKNKVILDADDNFAGWTDRKLKLNLISTTII